MTRFARALLLCPLTLALVAGGLLAGCDAGSDIGDRVSPRAEGLAYAESGRGVEATFTALTDALESAPPVTIVARVDHAQNAEAAGLSLPPTRVVLFGNPQLGTPLMQADPRAGIDLPQKMLVYRSVAGETYAAYNTTDYLAARHDLGSVGTLDQIAEALQAFAEEAAGNTVELRPAGGVEAGEGLVAVESDLGVDETYQRFRSAVQEAGALSILAELDHQANAASVGLELPPTRLLVFGNPALGTPLMQSQPTVGIDLPQKVLVYQEEGSGDVFLVYNDPAYLAARHGIEGRQDEIDQISNALAGLAEGATTAPGDESGDA